MHNITYNTHSITHSVNQYSLVKGIIERLRTANHNIIDELNLNRIELSNLKIWTEKKKKGIISDWADDSQSCISTNIDEHGWFFVPKKSKLLQCHEIEFQFALIQALSRIILSLVTFQLNYMNVKMPLTPFLRKCPINKSTVKYLLMKYIWNQQFITKEFMLDSSRNETSKLARTVLLLWLFQW